MAGIHAIIAAVGLAAGLVQASAGRAQMPEQPPEAPELVIGTKVAPPFAMKAADGTWRGIRINLWQRIANQTRSSTLNKKFFEGTPLWVFQ